jgi:hypothetical protein
MRLIERADSDRRDTRNVQVRDEVDDALNGDCSVSLADQDGVWMGNVGFLAVAHDELERLERLSTSNGGKDVGLAHGI